MTSIIFISVLPCNAQYFITSVYYYYYCCLEAALLLHTCDYPWKWWWQEMKLHSLNHTTTAWALVVIKSPLVKIHVSASVYYILICTTYSQLLTLGRQFLHNMNFMTDLCFLFKKKTEWLNLMGLLLLMMDQISENGFEFFDYCG